MGKGDFVEGPSKKNLGIRINHKPLQHKFPEDPASTI